MTPHQGVVPADTQAVLWQSRLARTRGGVCTVYVLSITRDSSGMCLVGAWARGKATMQHTRHLYCHDDRRLAARAALALCRRKEREGYRAVEWTSLDTLPAEARDGAQTPGVDLAAGLRWGHAAPATCPPSLRP